MTRLAPSLADRQFQLAFDLEASMVVTLPMSNCLPSDDPVPAPAAENLVPHDAEAVQPGSGPPFAAWLLAQRHRGDWIGGLAKAIAADRGFPRNGSPDQLRAHLSRLGAEGDMFEALDDAELHWGAV